MFKHCVDDYFWRVFICIPLFLTIPYVYFFTLTRSPLPSPSHALSLSLSPSLSLSFVCRTIKHTYEANKQLFNNHNREPERMTKFNCKYLSQKLNCFIFVRIITQSYCDIYRCTANSLWFCGKIKVVAINIRAMHTPFKIGQHKMYVSIT